MATILLVKPLRIPATEDTPAWELGELTITDEGLSWSMGGNLIYCASWEQWALAMTYSRHGTHPAPPFA